MPYQIINTANNHPVVRNYEPATFDDGAKAAEFLRSLKAKGDDRPLKIMPVADPLQDRIWQLREHTRMRDGTYVDVPFFHSFPNSGWHAAAATGTHTKQDYIKPGPPYARWVKAWGICEYHYAHVSMTDKSKLAYTESSEKGMRDIQTQIKPGAYLKKYLGEVLTHDEITAIVNDWQWRYEKVELKFARSPEDIVSIYQKGPRSCMSGTVDEYCGRSVKVHPCAVYGLPDSDITMAYVEGKNGISARCLVWEAEKKYTRIYGDGTLITRELHALGYTSSPLVGARIAKINAGKHGYIMPYIDDSDIVQEHDEKSFKIVHKHHLGKQSFLCRNTCGTTESREMCICTNCEDEIVEEDSYNTDDGEGPYCRACFNEMFFYCEGSGSHQPIDEQEEVRVRRNTRIGGGWYTEAWGEWARDRGAFYCETTGYWYHNDHALTTADGESISTQAVIDGHYFECCESGEYYPVSERVIIGKRAYSRSAAEALTSPER